MRLAADLTPEVLARALECRDARFDGVFFVAITSTGIYCRPVCPARVSRQDNRRFFPSAAAAERSGFRPCLRCRPELAPGRAAVDAVSRLARRAERRIAAGALNGRPVADLARELGVSERHLRRACERELGVTPIELAQTHRLLLAKRLLGDTPLGVTQIAYASGFQSLRRFNAAFRAAYHMPPSAARGVAGRRSRRAGTPGTAARGAVADPVDAYLRLTLAYRPPLAWDATLARLGAEAMPGVELVDGARYARTVRVDGHVGVVMAEDAGPGRESAPGRAHLRLAVSPSLAPALMPLLARLRHLFDLDAEPTVVDAHLAAGGLGALVRARPGLRLVGAVDGFEVALRTLLGDRADAVVAALGDAVETGVPGLSLVAPDAGRVSEAGVERLTALGVPRTRADGVVRLAHAVADERVRLDPGADADAVGETLGELTGAGPDTVAAIVARAVGWPDAFPAADPVLLGAAGVSTPAALEHLAERWRPWRAYAAEHLRLAGGASP